MRARPAPSRRSDVERARLLRRHPRGAARSARRALSKIPRRPVRARRVHLGRTARLGQRPLSCAPPAPFSRFMVSSRLRAASSAPQVRGARLEAKSRVQRTHTTSHAVPATRAPACRVRHTALPWAPRVYTSRAAALASQDTTTTLRMQQRQGWLTAGHARSARDALITESRCAPCR